jgi:hypothetical protein
MEYFITQALIALPVLGVNVLRATSRSSDSDTSSVENRQALPAPEFTMEQPREGLTARATEIDGEFTVLVGSHARRRQVGGGSYVALRERLERDGTIDTTTDPAVFTKNQVFASPSAAAAVVAGRSANGRTSWVEDSSGLTYGAWQNRGLDAV